MFFLSLYIWYFQVRIMRKRLVRKTFDMIQDISESENKEVCIDKSSLSLLAFQLRLLNGHWKLIFWFQDYKKFWDNFGRLIKLGCIEDSGNHKRITPLLRFYTSRSEEELKSLDDYVENMGENQKAIYYLATDSLKSAKTAPFLEKLLQKDIEVCILYGILGTILSSLHTERILGCMVVGKMIKEVFFFFFSIVK